MTRTSELAFESVTKTFGTTVALADFRLLVRSGELLTLLGPSGCGKTTALRIAAGFERPNSGRVLVNANDITTEPAHRRQMGMVFQSYSLFPHLSVIENVVFGLKMQRVNRSDARKRASEMLELVKIGELSNRYPHQLSGGQQQRVALARALASRPTVLLLDEPLSALDAKVRAEVRDEIRALTSRLGTTTLFVTHDQDEALGISDRVCVMNNGVVEQVGAPFEIYDHPASPFVASFVGELNRIRRGSSEIMVRPEQVVLTAPAVDEPGGEVLVATFHGSFARYRIRLDDGQIVTSLVAHSTGSTIAPGEKVGVKIVEKSGS
jgi:putative spermidine/putrescine transport system ATP-binding protein